MKGRRVSSNIATMALHFSANQYDKNFKPTLLQNWEVPRNYREKPRAFIGFTQIVANDRGHLLSGVKRSRESPWGTFVGTWDLPIKIPGNNMTNSTARTDIAMARLERMKSDGDIVLKGRLKQCKVPSPLPVKADKDADKTLTPKASNTQTQLQGSGERSGERSGAKNPEPVPSVLAPPSPGVRTPLKPATPTLDWPRPGSHGSRVQSACPNLGTSRSPLPAISSPKQVGTPTPRSRTEDLTWPSPKAPEQLPA